MPRSHCAGDGRFVHDVLKRFPTTARHLWTTRRMDKACDYWQKAKALATFESLDLTLVLP